MTLFFLSYRATANNKYHTGGRLFEQECETATEIGNALEKKLEEVRSSLDAQDIIATAFNKV